MSTQYKISITPRVSDTVYGDEVDVSDRVQLKGLASINKSIDGGDYDIGAYTYSDMTLSCDNSDGFFNVDDSRSMFQYSRDLAKVSITFFQEIDQEFIVYRGIIFDEATNILVKNDEIQIRVLGMDSVIKKASIVDGTIYTGLSISETIFDILNDDTIKKVLTVDIANISVGFDATVDDGSNFTASNSRDSINELLLASNSIMFVDEDDNIIVSGRTENTSKEPLLLYGAGDLRGRENIIDLSGYNTGLQRTFNLIVFSGRSSADADSIAAFGSREKDVDYSWLTNPTNIDAITATVLNEFKFPKIEFQVTVDTMLGKDYDLLDRVSVNLPLKAFPTSKFLPIAGATKAGDTNSLTPIIKGAVMVDPRVAFKIIAITHDTRKFYTTFKLRKTGTEVDDGYFT